jgi:hypothetical protein
MAKITIYICNVVIAGTFELASIGERLFIGDWRRLPENDTSFIR